MVNSLLYHLKIQASIAQNSVIGQDAVVLEDVSNGVLVVGNSARIIRVIGEDIGYAKVKICICPITLKPVNLLY